MSLLKFLTASSEPPPHQVIEILESDENDDHEHVPTVTSNNATRRNSINTDKVVAVCQSKSSAKNPYQDRKPDNLDDKSALRRVTSSKCHEERETDSSSNLLHEELRSSTAPADRVNPFAMFSFRGTAAFESTQVTCHKRSLVSKGTEEALSRQKKRRKKDWIPMRDLLPEQRSAILNKWHSFVDITTSINDARFQMVVAARLHARCQDGPVRGAMMALREQWKSLESFAEIQDPQELHSAICNLQYYVTKAKHIVQAARDVQSKFGGVVPEQEVELRQLTGIGPVMADLLAFVNTKEQHERVRHQHEKIKGKTV